MRNLFRSSFVAILFMFCSSLGSLRSAVAQSQDARSAARSLAQEGAQYYEKGDFTAALEKFKQAYGQYPSPKLLFNIGQALRGLSRNVDALAAFERFLAEAKDASLEYQAQATAQQAELNTKLARVAVDCNRPGASVAIDGDVRGTIPLAKPLIVEPGMHQLTLTRESEIKSSYFDANAGQAISLTLNFEGTKVEHRSADTPSSKSETVTQTPTTKAAATNSFLRAHGWYWIASGAVGLASFGTGVFFSVRTSTMSDKVSNASSWNSSDYSAGQQAQKLQWVFYGIGAAAAAGGVLLYLQSPKSTVVAPTAAPGNVGISAHGVF
jgi:hypothetical protein